MENSPIILKGFTLIQVFFDETSEGGHYLYLKENKVRSDQADNRPKGRTLFVNNVPPFCDVAAVRRIFDSCGKIARVDLTPIPGPARPKPKSKFFDKPSPLEGGQCAYIIFKHPEALHKALKMKLSDRIDVSTEEHPVVTGLAAYMKQYKAEMDINSEELQAELDTYMNKYDVNKQKEEERAAEEAERLEREDGWTVVTSKGKNKGAAKVEASQIKGSKRSHKKAKAMELVNFYSFQMRETKRDQLAELRKKFEADKQRVAQMRTQRKFKPY